MFATLLFALSTAHAGQTHAADELSGDWDVACTAGDITVSIQIAEATDRSTKIAFESAVTLPLACNGNVEDFAAFEADLYAQCAEAFTPDTLCDGFTAAVVAGLEAGADQLDGTFSLDVHDDGTWVNRNLGLYMADGTFAPLSGSPTTTSYLVNNNDGRHHGRFVGVRASGSPFVIPGCFATQATVVSGQVHLADDALEADFAGDASLWCPLSGARTGRVGITVTADLESL